MTQDRQHILIVDDEAIVRRIIKQRLSGENYDCREAGSAEEAMAKLAEQEAELVILDIKMPGKSGVELLQEIKQTYPDTAVIMATATTDVGIAIKCMRSGAFDYVVKPFNLDEISMAVQRSLEKRQLVLENRSYQQHLEQMVARRTAELKKALSRVKQTSLDTIHRLSRAAE